MTPDEVAEIDEQLKLWRQGDVVLTDAWPAVHLAHMAAPGTPASEELAASLAQDQVEPDLEAVMIEAAGFMVVSQTCDIVRTCVSRPYVEVCPLLPINAGQMPLVQRGRVPRYAWTSGLGNVDLAADLELVSTIEKAALVRFSAARTQGVATEAEARSLGEALGRKRSRAAFPNDFTRLITPLQKRAIERHGKDTPEGVFLRAIREIRVVASPDWQAEEIDVELLFVFESVGVIPEDGDDQVAALVARVVPDGRYASLGGRAVALDALTASAYLNSDRLDLEHLSAAAPET